MNTNVAIFLTSAAGLTACTFAQDPAQPKRTVVAVREFNAAMPVGYLGVPLGTVVRVTGVTLDGDTTGFRAVGCSCAAAVVRGD